MELNRAALFDLSPNPYMVLDRELRFVAANPAYLRATSSRLEELLGRTIFEAFPHDPGDPHNASIRQLRDSLLRVLETRQPDVLAVIPYRVPSAAGSDALVEHEWSATHTPVLDEDGEVAFILQHTVDVTELRRRQVGGSVASGHPWEQVEAGVLERARQVQDANLLLDRERILLRRLFEQAPGFICFLRGKGLVFELANRAYYQLVGHRELIGRPVREALREVDGQGFFELLDQVYRTGEPFIGRGMSVHLQREPGAPLEMRFADFVYQPVVDSDGSVAGIFVQGHDMTEQHRAQDELARYRDSLEQLVAERTRALADSEAERKKAEAALRQSQKLEAIGRLTGGVAHDFNNLLQIISGNLQLLEATGAQDENSRRRLAMANTAVDRGARLASQLLAFARRQPLEPKALNLGRLVHESTELLRRAVGDRVELRVGETAGLWNTLADPTQVENVLLNLAINARDAMEGEGVLTIEVANAVLEPDDATLQPDVVPGAYVRLAVADTGCGMPPDVLERSIEPFFSTKPEGRGSGLGLSMVYGFAKQSGGHMRIDSEPGRGTTIVVFLPRSDQDETQDSHHPPDAVAGGSETILVVEDDADVRRTVVDLLAGLGYRVHEAPEAEAALSLLAGGLKVDLLFTDVVMPGPLRSPELAARARERLPDLEVLFTSGYTENVFARGGRLDPGVHLLGKPYRVEELARKLRDVLAGRRQKAEEAPASQP